jgi:hypothetical protein
MTPIASRPSGATPTRPLWAAEAVVGTTKAAPGTGDELAASGRHGPFPLSAPLPVNSSAMTTTRRAAAPHGGLSASYASLAVGRVS